MPGRSSRPCLPFAFVPTSGWKPSVSISGTAKPAGALRIFSGFSHNKSSVTAAAWSSSGEPGEGPSETPFVLERKSSVLPSNFTFLTSLLMFSSTESSSVTRKPRRSPSKTSGPGHKNSKDLHSKRWRFSIDRPPSHWTNQLKALSRLLPVSPLSSICSFPMTLRPLLVNPCLFCVDFTPFARLQLRISVLLLFLKQANSQQARGGPQFGPLWHSKLT
jgi:hypothetical protein